MGFFLSVLYFVADYLTPPVLFGQLAQYRVELILAALLLLVSLPRLIRSPLLKTPQALALAGLAIAGFLSIFFAEHWLSGAIEAFLGFIPSIFAFFLVGLHCDSRNKLQALALMLLGVCLFVMGNGLRELRNVDASLAPTGVESADDVDWAVWNIEHPYLYPMRNGEGKFFYRLRGMGLMNDPNDFGQILVCEIPLLFLLWRPKKLLRNLALVLVPAGVLVYGVYLTHSRGALLALLAVILIAARRRIGTLPAGVIAVALFAGAMALRFTGGRAISASAGEDRTALWGGSMELLKSHLAFGIGIGRLPEFLGHTAHNSILVCAAELGFFGLFFWSLFLFPTLRDALLIASPRRVSAGGDADEEDGRLPVLFRPWKGAALDKTEINRIGSCLFLSLMGFLAAGLFLSRAFVMTFFLLGGMIEVVYETARRREMTAPRLSLARVSAGAFAIAIALIAAVYMTLRLVNLIH